MDKCDVFDKLLTSKLFMYEYTSHTGYILNTIILTADLLQTLFMFNL